MRSIIKVLRDILGIPDLRNRVLITIGLLGVYRIGFHIFLPCDRNCFLKFLNLCT